MLTLSLRSPTVDPERFVPCSLEVANSTVNCACAALSLVLTGSRIAGKQLEDLVVSMRTDPAYSYLYKLPGAAIIRGGPSNVETLNTTDLRLLARKMQLNIYLYVSTREDLPPHWEQYTGNKKGTNYAGIYLEMVTGSDGNDHVKLVYKVKPISPTD